jgi:Icc-related predicted phosphoesterase
MVKPKSKFPERFNLLALSDEVDQRIYNEHLHENFSDIDLLISCGDLPFYYLEYVLDVLNKPMFFVHGNHDPSVEHSAAGEKKQPWGADNLDNKVVRYQGLILVGFEGSPSYSADIYQYSQLEMWVKVLKIVPKLWLNKLLYGKYFDVLVTHAPAWDVSDQPDKAHRGFKAFRWLLSAFKPGYHLHGHVHIIDRSQSKDLVFEETLVVNAYTYKRLQIELEDRDG